MLVRSMNNDSFNLTIVLFLVCVIVGLIIWTNYDFKMYRDFCSGKNMNAEHIPGSHFTCCTNKTNGTRTCTDIILVNGKLQLGEKYE